MWQEILFYKIENANNIIFYFFKTSYQIATVVDHYRIPLSIDCWLASYTYMKQFKSIFSFVQILP
jgi:hypothetical protein